MSKQFIINANFRHHKKGDILPDWEYKKLPFETKEHCTEYIKPEPPKVVVKEEVKVEVLPETEPVTEQPSWKSKIKNKE